MTSQELNSTFDRFLAENNGKFVERVDPGSLNQSLDHLFDLGYNGDMRILTIHSKTHGKFEVLLDDNDFETISSMGKWNVHVVRGVPYVQKRIKKNILISLQRFLTEAKKGEYVDHIDHNTLNNQRANLRVTTNSANLRNGRLRANNNSGHAGVYKTPSAWIAFIKVKYHRKHLGSFRTFEEAVLARKEAERRYWND